MPSKEYYATHKEQYAKYYQDNKGAILSLAKEQRKLPEVKQKNTERARKYVGTHREQFNAYQRKYQKEHRDYHIKWKRKRNRELKKWAVDKLGRKCINCGLVTEFDCAYDFHHEDRSKSWSKCVKGYGQRRADSIRRGELVKWQKADKIPDDIKLLCSNCHRIRHYGDKNE